MKRIDPELKRILQADLKKYLKQFPDATAEEKRAVREWVAEGNSPYDNSWLFYSESGWPMDFITAERRVKEFQELCEQDPEAFWEWWGSPSDDTPLDPYDGLDSENCLPF